MTILDKLLSNLFTQYQTGHKRRFGSRFSTWWGQKMLGTTVDKGLGEVRKDLRSCYYDLPIDRRPPRKDEELKEWMADSKLVMPTRVTEERFAGQGQFLLSATLTFLFCAMAWGVTAIRDKGGTEGAPVMSSQVAAPGMSQEEKSVEQQKRDYCDQFKAEYPTTWQNLEPGCQNY